MSFLELDKPFLPCQVCRKRGWTMKDGFAFTCEPCRGFGRQLSTMKMVRREYAGLRKLYSEQREISTTRVDEMVRSRVERAKLMGWTTPTIWFDVLFFIARDFGIEDMWWDQK